MNKVNTSTMIRTKDMTKVAMLSVIGFVLMYFQLPLTFVAPPFMKLDISDLPSSWAPSQWDQSMA